jgi:hypothetical protein
MTETTRTCGFCGETFELPPDDNEPWGIQFSHLKEPPTGRYTGQSQTVINGTVVHECVREVPRGDPSADRYLGVCRMASEAEVLGMPPAFFVASAFAEAKSWATADGTGDRGAAVSLSCRAQVERTP